MNDRVIETFGSSIRKAEVFSSINYTATYFLPMKLTIVCVELKLAGQLRFVEITLDLRCEYHRVFISKSWI